ncbi:MULTISPECIES: SemiSWEET family transporter [unclassified Brenneria]|uniref:SemiSWEET family sugar transporter n=1 Tax=unclassified Brenneria TaxID=2634434 RepID=UPI0029C58AE7|nr:MULTISPECIES: SemiSWEET family transporter [unclassified Brenneria]MDX5630235.1 SemiSWEET family transporter [Brenneria sp. L3-3Z]MDX5697380.1 SemiSWEET family transporter [Brenneria sp. L4-2C]MEE3664671.1 SemiSWEET family transporter [Brenneria sp. g21c3]
MKKHLLIVSGTFVAAALSILALYHWSIALGTLAAWVTTGSFFLQVVHIIRNKDTTGISLGMYAALFFGVSCWTAYGFKVQDVPVMTANGITTLLALVVMGLKIYNEREIKPRKRRKVKTAPLTSPQNRLSVAGVLKSKQV